MRIYYSVGRYAEHEDDVVFVPPRWRRQWPNAVVSLHASGGSAAGAAKPARRGEHVLLRRLAKAGFFVIAPDLGGPSCTWGNDLSVDRIERVARYLECRWGIAGPLLLLGTSMGATDMFRFAADHPEAVAALVAVTPVCDLEALRAIGADDLQTNIDASWGVRFPEPLPAGANPADWPHRLRGVPLVAYYASDDPLIPTRSVVEFAGAAGGRAVDLGPRGHAGSVAAVPVRDVARFFRSQSIAGARGLASG